MTQNEIDSNLVGSIRLNFSKGQFALIGLIIIVLIGLGYSTSVSSSRAVEQAQVTTQVETVSASIIFTQREALVYSTRYAQWLGGSITRRDVQIARALLAQRLSVVDVSGLTMGARATPEFAKALIESDALLAQAPEGFLPPALTESFSAKAAPIISEIIDHSRKLIVEYQRDLDAQFRRTAVERADSARLNLILLALLISLTTIFLFWVAVDFRRKYLLAKAAIIEEQNTLIRARNDLNRAESQLVILQDLNTTKNEFISTINHELRTPLTAIIGYVDLLQNEDSTENKAEFKKIVGVLESNATALLDLVESILSLTKLDTQTTIEATQNYDLRPILEKTIVMLSPQAKGKGVSVNLAASTEELFVVAGDRTQLSQIFVNLISNAIKFSNQDGEVEISLRRVVTPNLDVHIEVAIKDHGIGIPENDLDKLFIRFFRAKNATESHIPGTGLGLAIVKKTMDLHHGEIKVESKEGVGSIFTLIFPGIQSEVEKLVADRRLKVLEKAILSLQSASVENLAKVCHSMGGSISFYTFEAEGAELEKFSELLNSEHGLNRSQIEFRQQEFIERLKRLKIEITRQKAVENE